MTLSLPRRTPAGKRGAAWTGRVAGPPSSKPRAAVGSLQQYRPRRWPVPWDGEHLASVRVLTPSKGACFSRRYAGVGGKAETWLDRDLVGLSRRPGPAWGRSRPVRYCSPGPLTRKQLCRKGPGGSGGHPQFVEGRLNTSLQCALVAAGPN